MSISCWEQTWLRTHIRLRGTQLELNDGNFCLFHSGWASSGHNNILVEDNTFHQFCIFNGPTNFLDDANISKVYIWRSWSNKSWYRCHGNGSQCRRVLWNNLSRKDRLVMNRWHSLPYTLEFREVLAARKRLDLSLRSTGVDISVKYSTALAEARRNDSATIVGWIPFCNIFSAAPSKLPAKTTTEVVPSPASISCAAERSTNWIKIEKLSNAFDRSSKSTHHFCSGMQSLDAFQDCSAVVCHNDLPLRCLDLPIYYRLSYLKGGRCMEYATILSIPLGPNDVRTASLIAVHTNETDTTDFSQDNTYLLLQPCWIAAVP